MPARPRSRVRAVAAAAAALLAGSAALAGCARSVATESTVDERARTATSAAAVGGMSGLVTLAKREGVLVLSGYDQDDEGVAALVRGFQKTYGLAVRYAGSAAGSADAYALDDPGARESATGGATSTPGSSPTSTATPTPTSTSAPTSIPTSAPTVTAAGMAPATATSTTTTTPTTTTLTPTMPTTGPTTPGGPETEGVGPEVSFAAYTPAEAASVPAAMKDPDGRWVADTVSLVAIGYDARRGAAPATWADLADPSYKSRVAFAADPTEPGPGLDAVVTMALAGGGDAAHVAPGVALVDTMTAAGTLRSGLATDDEVSSGQATVVLDSEAGQLRRKADLAGVEWRLVLPPGPVVGEVGAAGVNAAAAHPAAARLWLEYLLSDPAQNARLDAGLRPTRLAAMVSAGTVDKEAYAALPPVQGQVVTLTAAQTSSAAAAVRDGLAER